MNQWSGPSGLDRGVDRQEIDLDRVWRGGRLVEVDRRGNIASTQGKPRVSPTPRRPRGDEILLGFFAGHAWFVRPVDDISGESIGWRDMDTVNVTPLAAAVALVRWHATAASCESCGGATQPDLLGARRRCTECSALIFARIDPCIIVAITDPAGRLLLARQASWPPERLSLIAGFIEAGESAEQACHREASEEVGVRLRQLRYVVSQPWPVPRSLMLGFEARAVDDGLRVDGEELIAGAYYTRSALTAAVAAGTVSLPPGISIARHLIERWLNSG